MQAPLANSELAIMELLWEEGQMTARQIREALYSEATKAQHGTVQKLLQRLEEKGYIDVDRSLFVHQFNAKLTRQKYGGEQLESLASKLTSGTFAPLITHLVEANKISDKDINDIRAIIDEYTENQGEAHD